MKSITWLTSVSICLISVLVTGCMAPAASQRVPASPYCEDGCVGFVTSVPYYYVYPGYDTVYHPGYYVIPSRGGSYHYHQK